MKSFTLLARPTQTPCLRRHSARRFAHGYTAIAPGARLFDTGMEFGVLRLRRGETLRSKTSRERLWVLLSGKAEVRWSASSPCASESVRGQRRSAHRDDALHLARESVFDQGPSAVHAGPGEEVILRGGSACEWLLTSVRNSRSFSTRAYLESDCAREDRGAGLAQGACRRLVRTIFDHAARPDSQLVAGEVVNYPGRWSTYPPHHHPQPEIYHYRFTLPQGYGHAELGENVYKVSSGDTLLIPGGLDHSQVSAPGYGMYYFWVIRHLPRQPYRGFRFTPAHRWLLDSKRQGWSPRLPA